MVWKITAQKEQKMGSALVGPARLSALQAGISISGEQHRGGHEGS